MKHIDDLKWKIPQIFLTIIEIVIMAINCFYIRIFLESFSKSILDRENSIMPFIVFFYEVIQLNYIKVLYNYEIYTS